MNNIGKRIKELRKKYDLTQVELSERAGVGLRFIRELENNKATIRLDKLNQVLRFFGHHIEIIKDEK
ncbi:helix-turn-helix transcriptional regulator [Candidatus Calescamantes bacterium]|nr:helix-turn-helix transcriptional regulator [Candidatus Calescamantes bacterium]MCK5398817.1 helix-turn-helix transcriptional regulator [bacterium]MCK5598548.1 helix-turn-helix transcriptional regulator [bacterium]